MKKVISKIHALKFLSMQDAIISYGYSGVQYCNLFRAYLMIGLAFMPTDC
jgi:hypothetical protein